MLHIQKKKKINDLLLSQIKNPPSYDFESFDNSIHRLWCVNDIKFIEDLKSLMKDVNAIYITDGHH